MLDAQPHWTLRSEIKHLSNLTTFAPLAPRKSFLKSFLVLSKLLPDPVNNPSLYDFLITSAAFTPFSTYPNSNLTTPTPSPIAFSLHHHQSSSTAKRNTRSQRFWTLRSITGAEHANSCIWYTGLATRVPMKKHHGS